MTNETQLLSALVSGLQVNPDFQPQNNKQAYLAYLCGLDIPLPEPRTAEEALLCKLCVDGIVGGGGSLKINNATRLFGDNARLDQLPELLRAVSGATDMSYMFEGCTRLYTLDMSEVDTSNVTDMHEIFDSCYELREITGFSAVGLSEGDEVIFPSDISDGMCILKRLVFRTDLPNGQLAIKAHIDLSGAPMTRIPMIEMFESLPDVSKIEGSKDWAKITINGTGAATGRTIIEPGSHEEAITTPERFEELIELYSLYEAVLYVTNKSGKEVRMGMGDTLLENVKRTPDLLPFHKLRWEEEGPVMCTTLTSEDEAIATNKGWNIVR